MGQFRAEVENGPGTHAARLTQILLPSTFAVKRRANYLAFGPVGTCRSTGSIRIALVESSAGRAEEVLDEQLPDGRSYGSGTNGDAVWGIVNGGGGKLRGAYVRATGSRTPGSSSVPRRRRIAAAAPGGYRESVAYPLADALAATKASGY